MDMQINFDYRDFEDKMKRLGRRVGTVAEDAMHDIADELTRISSEIVPLDKGTLMRSNSKKVTKSKYYVEAEVGYSVREGGFNYAIWIHEGIYNHGETTQRRSGTVGWSGKRYYAGRKYLERPLKGEQEAFFKHIAKCVEQALGN